MIQGLVLIRTRFPRADGSVDGCEGDDWCLSVGLQKRAAGAQWRRERAPGWQAEHACCRNRPSTCWAAGLEMLRCVDSKTRQHGD